MIITSICWCLLNNYSCVISLFCWCIIIDNYYYYCYGRSGLLDYIVIDVIVKKVDLYTAMGNIARDTQRCILVCLSFFPLG